MAYSGKSDRPHNTGGTIDVNRHGNKNNVMLGHTNKIILWGYFALDVFPQNIFRT
jgi:hypothetical protein